MLSVAVVGVHNREAAVVALAIGGEEGRIPRHSHLGGPLEWGLEERI
jgi:hypothetical protein